MSEIKKPRHLSDIQMRLRLFNATHGMEYNLIQKNRMTSKHLWEIDIARDPMIVKDFNFHDVDVQAQVRKVNRYIAFINGCQRRFRGRV